MSEQGEEPSRTPFRSAGNEAESLERCTTLLNTVDDGIYRLDAAGRFVAVNDAIVEMTGYSREDLLGEHASMLVLDVDVERLEREIRTRLETGTDPDTTYDLAIETAAGDRVPCELRLSILGDDGEFEGTVGVARPIEDPDRTRDHLPSIWEPSGSVSSVIDEADVGMFVLDSEFDVVWIDESIEEFFGIDRTAVVGRHKRTLIEESIRDRLADSETFAETVLATYDDNSYVERFECQVTAGDDREERWLEHRSKPIESGRFAGGRVELYYDITDRKRAERARRESERRLQREHELTEHILETSPVGIAVVNPDGTAARANRRMAELLDLPAENESYTTTQRAMYDEDGEFLPTGERPVSRVFETGAAVTDREILLKSPDGQRRWLSINARPIANERGDPEQVVETATDVTDLKELAERRKHDLEEREKELAAVRLATNLLESGSQPVDRLVSEFVTTLPQFFQYPDRTAARVSIGSNEATTDAYEPLERRITARTATVNGTPITIDVVLRENAGGPEHETVGFLDEEQALIETLATLLKFHFDRREYISDLQESNERLEQFAYAASHDLQEPLRMVSSYLRLIESRYGDEFDDEGETFLEYAIDGAERMRSMIDGLLQYSRVETRGDDFERVDLDDVLEGVIGDLQLSIEETDADVSVEPLPVVEGDASQLRQVFQNLLDNALEYSGDEPPDVTVSAERTGSETVVSVRDEGIGIDIDDQERIFEVFQRLHTREEHAGTGIGLALCRRIVERHGGELWVESEPGAGTTFSFTLPLAGADDS